MNYFENKVCPKNCNADCNDCEKIIKERQALEIIKEKPQIEITHIQWGKIKTYDEYLKRVYEWDIGYEDMILTKEEYDLLKEVML